MSYFQENSFKQNLLEFIEDEIACNRLSRPDVVSMVAEVLSHLADTAFSRDEEIKRIRTEVADEMYQKAKEDLIRNLSK